MLSGEPVPVEKTEGDPLTGATLNGTGTLVMVAERIGADTVLARIVEMVKLEPSISKLLAAAMPSALTILLLTANKGHRPNNCPHAGLWCRAADLSVPTIARP